MDVGVGAGHEDQVRDVGEDKNKDTNQENDKNEVEADQDTPLIPVEKDEEAKLKNKQPSKKWGWKK